MKNIRIFLLENVPFLVVKFWIYLNRRVFVMFKSWPGDLGYSSFPISLSSFKTIAQTVFEISCLQVKIPKFSKGNNKTKSDFCFQKLIRSSTDHSLLTCQVSSSNSFQDNLLTRLKCPNFKKAITKTKFSFFLLIFRLIRPFLIIPYQSLKFQDNSSVFEISCLLLLTGLKPKLSKTHNARKQFQTTTKKKKDQVIYLTFIIGL